MTTRLKRRRIPLLLALFCLALAGALYSEAEQPVIEAPPPDARAAVDRSRPKDPTFAMQPLNTYAEVVARNLFSPTRRPPSNAPMAKPPSSFTLVGIIISPQERHALVAHGAPPRLERVVEGQNLDGWTIKSILADHVVLTQGETELDVKPADKSAPLPPRGPAQALVPPQRDPTQSPLRPQPWGGQINPRISPGTE